MVRIAAVVGCGSAKSRVIVPCGVGSGLDNRQAMGFLRFANIFAPCGARLRALLCLVLGLALSCLNLCAQTSPQPSPPQSELARQNMTHVAASVGQLVAVLHRDPGLMVELKRWIAKDATDHGQLISDSDLTDEAIFDRLESDITFRSVATALVQKYGYLQPSVNPESPLADSGLLMQERVKWIAQDEAAERAKARQQQRGS